MDRHPVSRDREGNGEGWGREPDPHLPTTAPTPVETAARVLPVVVSVVVLRYLLRVLALVTVAAFLHGSPSHTPLSRVRTGLGTEGRGSGGMECYFSFTLGRSYSSGSLHLYRGSQCPRLHTSSRTRRASKADGTHQSFGILLSHQDLDEETVSTGRVGTGLDIDRSLELLWNRVVSDPLDSSTLDMSLVRTQENPL